jgi:hypothetical protein
MAIKTLTKDARLSGWVTLNLLFTKDGKNWVGVCEELGVSAFDKSLERAKDILGELVLQHLNCLEREGVRESFFKEYNIKISPVAVESELIKEPVRSGTMVMPTSFRIPSEGQLCPC